MSENENSPAGRVRGRKAKVVPEMDLPPSQVREIADPDAAPETPNPENPAQPQGAAASPPNSAAPAARISTLLLALFAGLVGGGIGGAVLFAARPAASIEVETKVSTARLATLEAALAAAKVREDELKAEIAALDTRLSSASGQVDITALEARTAALGQQTDALGSRLDKLEGESRRASKGVDALQPRLDGLENSVATLSGRLGSGEGRNALALANGRIAAQNLLDEAFAAALPYAEPLDLLARIGANADLIGLARPFAESGAPSAKTLREEFLVLKPKTPAAAGAGMLERAGNALRGLVQIRQRSEAGDKGDEAVLNRVDRALAQDDLANALAASAELSPTLAPAYASWRARLEARIRAGEAVSQLRRQAQAALARAASQK